MREFLFILVSPSVPVSLHVIGLKTSKTQIQQSDWWRTLQSLRDSTGTKNLRLRVCFPRSWQRHPAGGRGFWPLVCYCKGTLDVFILILISFFSGCTWARCSKGQSSKVPIYNVGIDGKNKLTARGRILFSSFQRRGELILSK